jgi:LCP family protein required for cell wall assembly
VLAGVLVLAVGASIGVWAYGRSLNGDLRRTDAFNGLSLNGRPPVRVAGAMNVLLLGSDSRNPDNGTDSRSDTMMLMHLDADHQHAYVISIPRDSWVHVPDAPDGSHGSAMAKINSAYAWGGVPLAVETVEQFTDVRIDHVVLIDFSGFQQIVDAVGGIDLTVDQTVTSIFPPYRVFKQGKRHFTGAEALDYVRQRYQYADGDFARERHQQQFLAALLDKAASAGTLSDPGRLNTFLRSVTRAMTVDQSFDLLSVAVALHNLRSGDVTFLTSPTAGGGTEGDESVVYPDLLRAASLYRAVQQDTVSHWVHGGVADPGPTSNDGTGGDNGTGDGTGSGDGTGTGDGTGIGGGTGTSGTGAGDGTGTGN